MPYEDPDAPTRRDDEHTGADCCPGADVEARLEQLVARLHPQGLRVTAQRAAIARTLFESERRPSADEVNGQVLAIHPATSLAAVYSTPNLLVALGDAMEILTFVGKRYDRRPVPHPHLVCTGCGEVIDLELDLGTLGLAQWARSAAEERSYWFNGCLIQVAGLCPPCQDGLSGEAVLVRPGRALSQDGIQRL